MQAHQGSTCAACCTTLEDHIQRDSNLCNCCGEPSIVLSRRAEVLRLALKRFYLGHAYNITINAAAKIGKNCNIHKGVVIGQTNRGKNKGVPTIGNEVWIGINAAIVGNITIGDDVLIAPNSFVNVDVPSHSVVYGNPCTIHPRPHATEGYINRKG